MIDLTYFRNNLAELTQSIGRKKFSCELDLAVELDQKRREAISLAEKARAGQKSANVEMSQLPKGSPEFIEKVKEMKSLASQVKVLEGQAKEADAQFHEVFMTIPNIPHSTVPDGKGEAENKVVSTWGDTEGEYPNALPHFDIPWFDQMIDFPRGVKVAGAGFPFYLGDMSKLVRALINFFLDEASSNGYEEIHSPIVVNSQSATATGQLPDKEGQMYHAQTDDFYLIPTAEMVLTNLVREQIVDPERLPIRITAWTPCFRSETGAAGKDTRGMIRQHQFDKVELVKITTPESSMEELETLTANAEKVLQLLGLHYRVIELCTGDIGFGSAKTYDIEVWLPSQKTFREISSCSNCGDFQARRMNLRFRRNPSIQPPIPRGMNSTNKTIESPNTKG